jgi:hypothetical protein
MKEKACMPRSVTISTPIPTLEELGKRLGLSKRRQDALLRLMERDATSGRVGVRHRRGASGTGKEKATVARPKR